MSGVVLLGATTLIALGSIGELDLLANFDGDLLIPEAVAAEVTTEPASTNLDRFLDRDDVHLHHTPRDHDAVDAASQILDVDTIGGDGELIAGVLAFDDETVGVVSDDRRVRTISEGLGATVTGTNGVIVRAVHGGTPVDDGKELVRRVDSHGLHLTGELRETAYALVEEAAKRDD